MKKKKIVIIACTTVLCVILARIIYVNVTYPFAGIRYKNQGESISYLDNSYIVDSAELFNKNQWLNYIDDIGINEESKEHNIMHPGMDSGQDINDYDYYVGYNPDEDYKVLVIGLQFDSDIDEDIIKKNFSVVGEINASKEFFDDYYSEELQSINEQEKNADNAVRKYRVYIIKDDVDKLFLQTLEFGNNVMVRLNPEIVQ